MSVITGLEPYKVFKYFEEICGIPHGSKNEEALSRYCVEFAAKRGLEYYRDELCNVIIIKEASKGYEDRPAVIIQGHLDMVCEKDGSSTLDFERDGLKLKLTDGYLHADGTTLGGDDGIAVAYALALLDSDDIKHPRLEVVLTVCEELGMEGAEGIDLSMLSGRYLLNIDSEEEGVLLAGCAGGCHVACRFPVDTEVLEEAEETEEASCREERVLFSGLSERASCRGLVRIDISGLTGGHSGCEIHKGRANANVIAGRLLLILVGKGMVCSVSDIAGGSKDNAIPVSSYIVIETCDADGVCAAVDMSARVICSEYKTSDPDMKITCTVPDKVSDIGRNCRDSGRTSALAGFINSLPNGIIEMSSDMPGLVETSLNLGTVKTENDCVILHYLLRSSKDTALDHLISRMRCICSAFSAEMSVSSRYPAWEYDPSSKLRRTMIGIYEDLYGRKPDVEVMHAGVECGMLAAKLEGLDCVSFGPDILDIHTPRERMSVVSVQRTWEYLLEILKNLGENE